MRIFTKIRRTWASCSINSDKFCCICHSTIGAFLPYKGGWGKAPLLMRALDVIGSDLDNFSCPRCGSTDRERHLVLYLEKMELMQKFRGVDVLHFAPERCLSKIIAAHLPARYVKADLYPNAPDVEKVDMLAIQYPNASFDVVIANHVFEHVLDDNLALSELYRVLKPGGFAILQTPFSAKLKRTFSDPGINDDFSRLQAYGQEDHARLYGSDIVARIESSGLVSRSQVHEIILSAIDARKYGVNKSEPFLFFEKAQQV